MLETPQIHHMIVTQVVYIIVFFVLSRTPCLCLSFPKAISLGSLFSRIARRNRSANSSAGRRRSRRRIGKGVWAQGGTSQDLSATRGWGTRKVGFLSRALQHECTLAIFRNVLRLGLIGCVACVGNPSCVYKTKLPTTATAVVVYYCCQYINTRGIQLKLFLSYCQY